MVASWISVVWFNNGADCDFEEQNERDLKENDFSFEDMSKEDKKSKRTEELDVMTYILT